MFLRRMTRISKQKVARGILTYECLIEGCGVKLKTYKSRQQHLIDKHQFPKSFELFKKARPSHRQRQRNHRRQTAHKGEEEPRDTVIGVDGKGTRPTNWRYRPKQHDHRELKEKDRRCKEAKENEMDVEQKMDKLTCAVSMLSTEDSTPASVTFGHRRSSGLTFVPRSTRQNEQAGLPA